MYEKTKRFLGILFKISGVMILFYGLASLVVCLVMGQILEALMLFFTSVVAGIVLFVLPMLMEQLDGQTQLIEELKKELKRTKQSITGGKRYCKKCGQELKGGTVICPKCGYTGSDEILL